MPQSTMIFTTRDGNKVKVTIDRGHCIGSGTCVGLAPCAFALDNESKSFLRETAGDETLQAILNATRGCPVTAIAIEDENGNPISS